MFVVDVCLRFQLFLPRPLTRIMPFTLLGKMTAGYELKGRKPKSNYYLDMDDLKLSIWERQHYNRRKLEVKSWNCLFSVNLWETQ